MSHKIEQSSRFARSGGRMAGLIDVKISQLKRELEERLSRSQGRADWQEMLEDCDIILHHLERQPSQGKSSGPRSVTRLLDPCATTGNSRQLDR